MFTYVFRNPEDRLGIIKLLYNNNFRISDNHIVPLRLPKGYPKTPLGPLSVAYMDRIEIRMQKSNNPVVNEQQKRLLEILESKSSEQTLNEDIPTLS